MRCDRNRSSTALESKEDDIFSVSRLKTVKKEPSTRITQLILFVTTNFQVVNSSSPTAHDVIVDLFSPVDGLSDVLFGNGRWFLPGKISAKTSYFIDINVYRYNQEDNSLSGNCHPIRRKRSLKLHLVKDKDLTPISPDPHLSLFNQF